LFGVMQWVFSGADCGETSVGCSLPRFLYVFSLLSLGFADLHARAQNQIQALQMTMIFILPSVFFFRIHFPARDDALDFFMR